MVQIKVGFNKICIFYRNIEDYSKCGNRSKLPLYLSEPRTDFLEI